MLQRIKKKAEEAGIPIREIERRCGFPFGSLKRWDRIEPSVYKVGAVANVLGCTVDDLIREDAEPTGPIYREDAEPTAPIFRSVAN